MTSESGLATPSLGYTAFGVAVLDFDNDGDLDIATVNGAVHFAAESSSSAAGSALAQRNQLFENLGGAEFAEVRDLGLVAFCTSSCESEGSRLATSTTTAMSIS